jgi:TrwC relaxase
LICDHFEFHTHAPSDEYGQFRHARAAEAKRLVAVVATLSKGYDLDYIWKQVDRGPAKDAASYYIQASESGGEPPGRWWGPGAQALGFEPGQTVERTPYDLLFGERKAPDGSRLGRPPGDGRKAADVYAALLAAEPHATAERKRELRTEATKKARQSPLFFDLTISLSKSISLFHASLGENARLARQVLDGAEDSDGWGLLRHWGCRCGDVGRAAGGVLVGGGTVPMRGRGAVRAGG